MSLSRRYTFKGLYAEIYPDRIYGDMGGDLLTISFTPAESFHEFVKRLSEYEDEDQLKLAYAAIENEMGRRQI
jgi:hypothetical protein